ncbi:MAG: L-2-amino-thiazoline-4-carboxylic acid hydrolase [Candidatus Bathyarchaeia archaeon]
MSEEEKVPLTEAENEVKVVTQRLALLHLSYAKTLVEEFGWEKGKQLILDSIKMYGEFIAERVKLGHQSLPKYGFWERREDKPPLCELGKIMREYGEPEIGSLYCLVDPAKTMAVNPNEKMIHTKCMIIGDEWCDFDTISTSEEDRREFERGKDWSHVDPLISNYLNKRKEKLEE